jgi:3-isopropylmalate dehydrogenase
MLEHGLGRPDEARRLEAAVDAALASAPTPDLGGTATTAQFGDAVLARL